MAETHNAHVRFECCDPILRVENMQASLQFYVNVLGFENASWGNNEFTHVSRDSAGIYLCEGDQGRGGAWVWIGVEDTPKLHEEYKARGVTVRLPPTNFPWALEMQSRTPTATSFAWDQSPWPKAPANRWRA